MVLIGLTFAVQPRRFILPPSDAGCKRLLGSSARRCRQREDATKFSNRQVIAGWRCGSGREKDWTQAGVHGADDVPSRVVADEEGVGGTHFK
jgi:hypothetical protein